MPKPVVEIQRSSFARRVLLAARLQSDIFEEVEADRSAIGQATFVVLASCVAAAAGAWLRIQSGSPLPSDALPLPWHLALVGFEPLVTWLAGSAFAFMVGASFLRGPETETDYPEVLRTVGFAYGPGILVVLAWLPPEPVGVSMILLGRLWVLVASIVAVRQALDFTTLRAIGTYGASVLLLWLIIWGLTVAPLPSLR